MTAVENSFEALRDALAAGLDGFETDVQRTRDGVLVLHHDHHLNDGRLIARLDLGELRLAIPSLCTLAELFELLEEYPAAVVNLEVKTDAPFEDERASELTAAIARLPADLKSRLWLSSFDPLLLLRLAACEVAAPLAFLVSFEPALRLVASLPLAAVHPHKSLVTAERVRNWQDAGLKVYTWTVNDRATARELLAIGVDGLIGDDPETLLLARSSAAGTGRAELG